MMPQINSAKRCLKCNKKLKIKTMYRNILQSLVPKHVLKNMQSSRALLISLSLLRHLRQDSKDKAYKE